MAKVIFGNHSSVIVPRKDRDNIRKFYCDVLGCIITKDENDRDFLRLGENFYIAFLYEDVADESEFLQTARSIWLEIQSDNVAETKEKILGSGLVTILDIPDPHLYFQAPGGQCLRLVGINEDMSFYEGAGAGPDVAKVKEAINLKMKNVNESAAEDYTATIDVYATPQTAFEKIAQVDGWWAKNFTGTALNEGDIFKVDFGKTFVDFKISEAVPGKKIVWYVTDCNLHWINDKKEWKGTKLVWEISSEKNITQIKMTHVGLLPEVECYTTCKPGWDGHIKKSLVKFINEGNGTPE